MSSSPGAVMIFAAGLGTRMGALTANCPKPLLPLAGKPLIDHALDQCQDVGRIVVNVHYRADQIRAHLQSRSNIQISDEQGKLLETGGGLKLALPMLATDPVFTLNSDAGWTTHDALDVLTAAWNPAKMDGLLLLVPPERRHGHPGSGDFSIDRDGRLLRGGDRTYTGAQIIKTGGLSEFPEAAFSLNRLWDRMLDGQRLFGVEYPGHWADVGSPEGLAEAEAMLRSHP